MHADRPGLVPTAAVCVSPTSIGARSRRVAECDALVGLDRWWASDRASLPNRSGQARDQLHRRLSADYSDRHSRLNTAPEPSRLISRHAMLHCLLVASRYTMLTTALKFPELWVLVSGFRRLRRCLQGMRKWPGGSPFLRAGARFRASGRAGSGTGRSPAAGGGAGGVLDAGAREPMIEACGERALRFRVRVYAVVVAPRPACGRAACWLHSSLRLSPGVPGGHGAQWPCFKA